MDLFAGVGGMSLGFEQAGFDVLAAVDHDPLHLAVYEHNLPLAGTLCADVQDLHADDIASVVRKSWSRVHPDDEWDGAVDCLFGGPSCQGFSAIGQHDDDDSRNLLVFEFARLVRELRPRTFVMENVPGLLAPRFADTVRSLLARLRHAGYAILQGHPLVLDAADFGVPQTRRRVFIAGSRSGEPALGLPEAHDVAPTVADALDDIPMVEGEQSCGVTSYSEKQANPSLYVRSLRSPYAFEHRRAWDVGSLTGCQQVEHSKDVAGRFGALSGGEVDEVSNFRRLLASGRSSTLRAGTGRDHGSFTAARPVHHRYSRVITLREAARLHTFPDWFRFHRTQWHGFRQIGNSVPPRLAYSVATAVRTGLLVEGKSLPALDLELGDVRLVEMSLTEAADYFGYDRANLPIDSRGSAGHGSGDRHAGV